MASTDTDTDSGARASFSTGAGDDTDFGARANSGTSAGASTDTEPGACAGSSTSDQRQAYHTAIKLLSAREHSVYELTQKLDKRGYSRDLIEELLEDLQKSGYQSDARFSEQYARQRFNKGYGPLSIRARLSERGIDSGLASDALEALCADWQAHAADVISRKFREDDIASTESKIEARIARFLLSRGFSSSVALRALKECRQNL